MFDFKSVPLNAYEFFVKVRAKHYAGTKPCAVTSDSNGIPNRYKWPTPSVDANAYLLSVTQRVRGAYFTPNAFFPASDGSFKRGNKYVAVCRSLYLDVEGSVEKGGYAGANAVQTAASKFIEQTGLVPTTVVFTGSGGMHLYYTVEENLALEEWRRLAVALVETCERYNLRIDTPVSTDASRIMRAPGSIHQKTGVAVITYETGPTYSLSELATLVGYKAKASQTSRWTEAQLQINRDVLSDSSETPKHTPYSMLEMSKHCAAVRQAMNHRGRDTPYQPWLLALQTAVLSVEGEELGHAISKGHPDYDEGKVAEKMATFTGGPPSCQTWHHAWAGESPCPNCLYGGISQ